LVLFLFYLFIRFSSAIVACIGISPNLAWYTGLHQQIIGLNCAAQTYFFRHGRPAPPLSLLNCKVLNFTLGLLPCHMNLEINLSYSVNRFLGKAIDVLHLAGAFIQSDLQLLYMSEVAQRLAIVFLFSFCGL